MTSPSTCSIRLDTDKPDRYNRWSYRFENPLRTLRLDDPRDVESFFLRVEDLAKRYYVACWFSYELGCLLEPACGNPPGPQAVPYAFAAACDQASVFDHRLNRWTRGDPPQQVASEDFHVESPRLNMSDHDYCACVERIKRYIAAGDIYQANYTMKYRFGFSGDPLSLYESLRARQAVAYSACFHADDFTVLSFSPELFFARQGERVRVLPMKGTAPRGRNSLEDARRAQWLHNDPKNRAENVMIVDLLRNDLGRIARYGTVQTDQLFNVERFDTLHQMTSRVRARLRPGLSLLEMYRALFPSGSVTGAPKIRSMQILRKLEREPRGVYTGAIGLLRPGKRAVFNVAIRTIVLRDGVGEMGVGGGIVADSAAGEELREARLKGSFLVGKPRPRFSLIETMYAARGRIRRIRFHLNRLRDSAAYFGFRFDRRSIADRLHREARQHPGIPRRIRLLLERDGSMSVTAEAIRAEPGAPSHVTVCMSGETTDSSDVFLFHKTTHRELYNRELARARASGFFDTLFCNERGELTEGAITNVYVKQHGVLFTPPLRCGVLAGTVRQSLLAAGKAREKVLTPSDLRTAEEVYVSNALVGTVAGYISKPCPAKPGFPSPAPSRT